VSEAIQKEKRWIASSLSLLAMTQVLLPAARNVRVLQIQCPSEKRAREMRERRLRPQPRVQSKKAHELVTTVTPAVPAFPAAMVLTAYSRLSPVIGLFVTVIPEKR
jgi:hypothetical protein